MKPLPEYDELDVKVDASGEIDIDYYISKAHQERSKLLREMHQEIVEWAGTKMHNLHDRLFGIHCQHSH